MDSLIVLLSLGAIALFASIVNGALGYGFSSITVPLALFFLTNRALNPSLVLVEVAINVYVLVIHRRRAAPAFARTWTIVLGLLPGVTLGSWFLAAVHPEHIKLLTYVVLLPLILIQAAGLRRPLPSERAIGLPFGAGIGLLYSVTTISGPPLALLLSNQGYAKEDFRASLAVVRVAESSMTAVAYLALRLYQPAGLGLLASILPAVLIGVPVGTALIRRVDAETFRRICMSFDAWIVGVGLSRALVTLRLAALPAVTLAFLTIVLVDLVLLYRFFAQRTPRRAFASHRSASGE